MFGGLYSHSVSLPRFHLHIRYRYHPSGVQLTRLPIHMLHKLQEEADVAPLCRRWLLITIILDKFSYSRTAKSHAFTTCYINIVDSGFSLGSNNLNRSLVCSLHPFPIPTLSVQVVVCRTVFRKRIACCPSAICSYVGTHLHLHLTTAARKNCFLHIAFLPVNSYLYNTSRRCNF